MTVLVQSGRHPDRRRSMRGKCGIRRIRISRNTVCSPQGNAPLPSELYRKAFRVPEFLSKGQQLHCTFWKPVLQFIHSYTIIKWEEKQLFLKRYTNGLSGRVHTKKVSFLTKPQHHKQSRMFGSTCASLCALTVGGREKKYQTTMLQPSPLRSRCRQQMQYGSWFRTLKHGFGTV